MNIKKQLIVFFSVFIVSFIMINSTIYGIVTYRNYKLSQYDLNQNGFFELNEQIEDFEYWETKCKSTLNMLFLSKETIYISLILSGLFVLFLNFLAFFISKVRKSSRFNQRRTK